MFQHMVATIAFGSGDRVRTAHVETVYQLVLRKPAVHINIDVDVEELVQDKRGAATYGQINFSKNTLDIRTLFCYYV